jgi:hypothetical protein
MSSITNQEIRSAKQEEITFSSTSFREEVATVPLRGCASSPLGGPLGLLLDAEIEGVRYSVVSRMSLFSHLLFRRDN